MFFGFARNAKNTQSTSDAVKTNISVESVKQQIREDL